MTGRYQKKCCVTTHLDKETNTDSLISSENRKRFPNKILEKFFKDKLIPEKKKGKIVYVCERCLNKIQGISPAPDAPASSSGSETPMEVDPVDIRQPIALNQILDFVGTINDAKEIDVLESAIFKRRTELGVVSEMKDKAEFSFEEFLSTVDDNSANMLLVLDFISRKLGREFQNIKRDTPLHRSELIKSASYSNTWDERIGIWKQLIDLTVSNSHLTVKEREKKFLVKATDCLQLLYDQNYINPLSHAEALLLLNFSRSRYATDVFCHTSAAGSYSTIKRTIKSLVSQDKKFLDADIILGIDNNQVYQKTWSVKYKGTQKNTTVTSVISFQDLGLPNFQKTLKIPSVLKMTNPDALFLAYLNFRKEGEHFMAIKRQEFMSIRLKTLTTAALANTGTMSQEPMDVSQGCETMITDDLSYNLIENCTVKYKVTDYECLHLNPASTASVCKILDRVKEIKEKEQRNWILLYMDGSPHFICQKVIPSKMCCQVCNADITDDDNHGEVFHERETKSLAKLKYEGIVIRAGAGHFEMMLVKSILQTFWEPFVRPIAELLGYNTESSLAYCRGGSDNHKSWEILMVVFSALIDEIMSQYITSLTDLKGWSVSKFLDFCHARAKQNKMFSLTFDFLFEVLFPVYIFRSAIRQGNDKAALLARDYSSRILFGSSHPRYHEILAYDTYYLLSLPTNCREVVGRESCTSEKSTVGQGFDFHVEEKNKKQKAYLPSDGAPSYSQWVDVCGSIEALEEIKEITVARLGVTLKEATQKDRFLLVEKEEARKYYHENLGLEKTIADKLMTSKFQNLHPKFSEFTTQCIENQTVFFEKYILQEKAHLPAISNFEFPENLDVMTKEALMLTIKNALKGLQEPFFTFYKKSLSNQKSVEELRVFYDAMLRVISMQECSEYDSDSD